MLLARPRLWFVASSSFRKQPLLRAYEEHQVRDHREWCLGQDCSPDAHDSTPSEEDQHLESLSISKASFPATMYPQCGIAPRSK